MPRPALAACLFLLALAPSAARAGKYDLELFRLGHPDDIFVCTRCDGTDRVLERGDPGAQVRFARLTTALGLAFIPPFVEPARTTGQAGFELGGSAQAAFLRLEPSEWPSMDTEGVLPAPRVLVLPSARVRKGLGGSFELGAAATALPGSHMFALTGEARFAVVEGLGSAPDVGVRAFATRLLGARGLDLTVAGADLAVSQTFGVAGALRLEPYGQVGVALIRALSSSIDFRPFAVNPRDPLAQQDAFHSLSFQRNGYLRGTLGLRLVSGPAVAGVETGFAWGRNGVQSDPLGSGGAVPSQISRLWTASAHLGLAY